MNDQQFDKFTDVMLIISSVLLILIPVVLVIGILTGVIK